MDALERMFNVLVRTVRKHHPQQLSAPFTVAELYQQIGKLQVEVDWLKKKSGLSR